MSTLETFFAQTIATTLLALVIEARVGYPEALYRAIGHPVTWMGALLRTLEARLNRGSAFARRVSGVLALVVLLAATAAPALLLQAVCYSSIAGWLVLAVFAATLPAQRSLYTHVKAVADALEGEGLAGGRRAVSMIVGRDTAVLGEAGVARAAIESLAENFSDGIVAPLFWMAVAGLAGGALYKAANTADSMIGHRNARYGDFGWCAAQFDDLINLPASRLSALWIALASGKPSAALGAVRRDARSHRSPNAGWPEAAMAGALDLKLAGPRIYDGRLVDDAFMGNGRREANVRDIRRALRIYARACGLQFLVLALIGAAIAITAA